jgi:RNA-directed DNA polymerase
MRPPPLLVSYPSLDLLSQALEGDESLRVHLPEVQTLYGRSLPPAVTAELVAVLFGYSSRFVEVLCRRPRNYYRYFSIPKRRGGQRSIEAPKVALKVIQTWLGFHIAHRVTLPDCVHGFVPGKSIVTAAASHAPAKWVLSLDIKDFFSSTLLPRLIEPLGELGYGPEAIRTIGHLTTLDGHLPQGSPASPVLANLAFTHTDRELKSLASEAAIHYTRYADDLVFSGCGDIPSDLAERVQTIVEEAGWEIAESKTVLKVWPRRLQVLGLTVHGDTPRLPREYRNRLRAYDHMLEKGIADPRDRARLSGHLAFAKSIPRKE